MSYELFKVQGGLSISSGGNLELAGISLSAVNTSNVFASQSTEAEISAAKAKLPTEYSVKQYVDGSVGASSLLISADATGDGYVADDWNVVDTGGDSIETLAIVGTTNELETTISADNTIKLGLPDDVTIGNDLTVTGELNLQGDGILGNASEMVISADGTDASASGGASNSMTLNASGGIFTDDDVDMDGTLNVQGVTTLQAGWEMDHVKKDEFSIDSASGSSETAFTFAVGTYKSAKVHVSISTANGSDHTAKELMIVAAGSTAKVVEYALVSTGSDLTGSFAVASDGSDVTVSVTSGSGYAVKGSYELIK